MTSEELKQERSDTFDSACDLAPTDSVAADAALARCWLLEIAYQLARHNEANGLVV